MGAVRGAGRAGDRGAVQGAAVQLRLPDARRALPSCLDRRHTARLGVLARAIARALIGWSLGLAVALLIGGQELAVVTGLASGTIGRDSPWLAVVLAALAAFGLALIVVGIGGILLLRDLYAAPHRSP